MDVRLTSDLIKVTTCIDSLVAMRMILEGMDRSSGDSTIPNTQSVTQLTSNCATDSTNVRMPYLNN